MNICRPYLYDIARTVFFLNTHPTHGSKEWRKLLKLRKHYQICILRREDVIGMIEDFLSVIISARIGEEKIIIMIKGFHNDKGLVFSSLNLKENKEKVFFKSIKYRF